MMRPEAIALKNLKASPVRTAALILFAVLTAVSLFGGGLLVFSLQNGLAAVKSRLGADIMVVPENAGNDFDAQTVLVQAEPAYFYMDADVLMKVRAVEGVEAATPQLFLASMAAGCCSSRLQIIGFDTQTDFAVRPWVERTVGLEHFGYMDIIVGSNVTYNADGVIRFFGNDCHVAGQFSPTGSTMDNCVYADFDTIRALTAASAALGMNKYGITGDDVLSSVMVRVQNGADISEVAERIRTQVEGVSAVTASGMVTGVAQNVSRLRTRIMILTGGLWAVSAALTVLLFVLYTGTRRQEFAVLRAAGASGRMVRKMVGLEAAAVFLAGGAGGICLTLLLFPFQNALGSALGAGLVLPKAGGVIGLSALTAAVMARLAVLSAHCAARKIWQSQGMMKEGA